ncbi:hypothetical protein [Rhizobium jaguaris]|uniref:Uncharacterized protein n=1 Tax=Rhizobium jaguaris TaxID=1312183 RepID=A0A387G588_9HYPH|nr:hypothetical protein [Rhizobium jaguaris]AYG63092.1 hypothetical protein CCGE525_30810 [Rhizobium jaguaris]
MADVPYVIVGDMASWVHVQDQASNGVPFLFFPENFDCSKLLQNLQRKEEVALMIYMIRLVTFTN